MDEKKLTWIHALIPNDIQFIYENTHKTKMRNEEKKLDSAEQRKWNIHKNGEEELEQKITITFS
jgi:hypothetical protein